VLAGFIAIAISVAAAGLIFYSWRQRKQYWASVSGWVLAFASAIPWSWALGPEIGVTYAIMVFVSLVWAEVVFTMDSGSAMPVSIRRPFQQMRWPSFQGCFKHSLLFLLSVPASGVITMMLSVSLVLYLPWSMAAKLATAILLYPVLWGALSAWICAQDKLLKPTLVSAGLLAGFSLLLFT
jgi:hypothetical protein